MEQTFFLTQKKLLLVQQNRTMIGMEHSQPQHTTRTRYYIHRVDRNSNPRSNFVHVDDVSTLMKFRIRNLCPSFWFNFEPGRPLFLNSIHPAQLCPHPDQSDRSILFRGRGDFANGQDVDILHCLNIVQKRRYYYLPIICYDT